MKEYLVRFNKTGFEVRLKDTDPKSAAQNAITTNKWEVHPLDEVTVTDYFSPNNETLTFYGDNLDLAKNNESETVQSEKSNSNTSDRHFYVTDINRNKGVSIPADNDDSAAQHYFEYNSKKEHLPKSILVFEESDTLLEHPTEFRFDIIGESFTNSASKMSAEKKPKNLLNRFKEKLDALDSYFGLAPKPKLKTVMHRVPHEAMVPHKKSTPETIKHSDSPFSPKPADDTSVGQKGTRFLVSRKQGELTIVESPKPDNDPLPDRRGYYTFPKINLLADPVQSSGPDHDYSETMDMIVQVLNEFGVKVEPTEVNCGPVITRYVIKLLPGNDFSSVSDLAQTLATRLKVSTVRVKNIPTKSTVGIDLPNRKPRPVRLREIVESRAWGESRADIPIVLGKDCTGRPIVEDLTKMPHLLVAGASGSGKTNCVNAILASLLYHSGPEDIRFLIADPKILEYRVYDLLPHMLVPVVTNSAKIPGALKYLLRELELRYEIFARVGVRNISNFNTKAIREWKERVAAEDLDRELFSSMSEMQRASTDNQEMYDDLNELEIPTSKLPCVLFIFDGLEDIIDGPHWKEIEIGLSHLMKLGRAAGIHCIATVDNAYASRLGSLQSGFQTTVQMTANNGARTGFAMPGMFRLSIGGGGAPVMGEVEAGYVYIMSNPVLPENFLKIGLTTNTPEQRAKELSSATGVPESFEVLYQKAFDNCRAAESAIHQRLKEYRVSKNREFFNCPIDYAINAIEEIGFQLGQAEDRIVVQNCIAPFISDDELSGIIEFINSHNGGPEFDSAIQRAIKSASMGNGHVEYAGGDWDDELIPQAIDVLRTTKRASTSMLQRRLKIGYNRCARIMEILEDEGIVGPENGSSPREILRDLDSL